MLQQPSQEKLHEIAGPLAPGKDRRVPWQARVRDPAARAAFSLWSWKTVQFAADQVPCDCCGLVTAAFCGGCDFRARDSGAGNPAPWALCAVCDSHHYTCRACTNIGITGAVAARRHRVQYPLVHEKRGVVIYGHGDEEGVFTRLDEPREIELTPEECREFNGFRIR